MTPIIISVPAKIHLLGEHSVVYGKPALLSAINLRVNITISPSDKKYRHSTQNPQDKNAQSLQKAIEDTIKKRFELKNIPPYHIKLDSEIPMGYGLGSSAAISSAYTAALLSFLKLKWDNNLVAEIAYEGERVFHGNPSGGDVAAVINGGFLWFRKEVEFLRIVYPIQRKIHPKIGNFILIDSGKPAELTKELVLQVKQNWQKSKSRVNKILEAQEELTKQLLIALLEGDTNSVINVIRLGQANLEKLGVVGKKAKTIIKQIETIGGACKIIGGGGIKEGSGMLLAYHQNSKKLSEFIKQNGLKFNKIKLGESGLRVEQI